MIARVLARGPDTNFRFGGGGETNVLIKCSYHMVVLQFQIVLYRGQVRNETIIYKFGGLNKQMRMEISPNHITWGDRGLAAQEFRGLEWCNGRFSKKSHEQFKSIACICYSVKLTLRYCARFPSLIFLPLIYLSSHLWGGINIFLNLSFLEFI